MKKKAFLRMVIAAILAMITVFAVTTAAAEYAAGDGMTFEIVTSKQEYGVNEEIQIILLAKNYNGKMKLANISWTAEIPTGELTMLSGELAGTQTVEVGERAVVNYRLMKIVEPPEEPDEPEPTTPSTQPQETPTVEEEGVSGGSIAVLIILIILVFAGIGGIVYLLLKRRGVISCIALLLALGMLLPCIPAVDVSAAGLNIGDMIMGDNNALNASVKFVVDGKEYEATATITYEMANQTETVVEAMDASMSKEEWPKYNLPAITPTIGEHPRLRFTSADIPRIIENLEAEENKNLKNEFHRLVGISFNGNFGALANENAKTNYSSDKLNSIRAKALYYALYKNSEKSADATLAQFYGKTAVKAIQKAMETIIFAPGYDVDTRSTFLSAAAEVYDWCYELLTYKDKQTIAALSQDIGALSEPGWPIIPGPAVVSHMGGGCIQTYWMAIAIAMYDEYPTFYEQIGGMYFDIFIKPRNAWYVSQTHHQGASYGVPGRYSSDMDAQYQLFAMTGGFNDLDGDGKQDGFMSLIPEAGLAPYQLLYSMRPDGQMLREGDVWEENQTNKKEIWDSGVGTIYLVASVYKDGILKRLAFEQNNLRLKQTELFDALIYGDSELETKSYTTLPYTKYFGLPSASMIARTGWDMGIEADDVLVKMQLTPAYVDNHQHRDAGAFQIYYKGILASESGYYVIYNTQHDIYYNKSSIAHNTLSITSMQNRYGTQTYAYDTSWGHEGHTDLATTVIGEEFGPNTYKPAYSYLAGDIAGAYDANVQEAVRSMLFLNLDLEGNKEYPGAFIVFDQIKTTEVGSKKSFLLHMQSEPEIDGNVITVKNTADDYNGKLTQQVVYVGTANQADKNYTIEKIGGPGKQFLVGKYNYAHSDTITSNLCQEQGWGRVEVTTKTTVENQTDYLLNVLYVGDADKDAEVVPAKLIYDGKGVIMGAQLMNHVAMFNMDGNNRISKEVSFTIPKSEGYNTFKVNVAGLKAGTWTVYVGGKSVGTQVASEDGGMIYFEAAAGTVKLVYTDANSTKTFDETPITEEEPIGLMVNNFYYYTDNAPVAFGDDYLVPAVKIMKALNAREEWNNAGTEVTLTFKGVPYVISQSGITVDGNTVEHKEIQQVGKEFMLDMFTLKQILSDDAEVYYDALINRIRVNEEPQESVPSLSDKIKFNYPTAVQVDAVIDLGYSTVGMVNCLDGDPTTRWVSQENNNNISEGVFDFGKVIPLTEVMLMFYTEQGNYSDYVFDVLVSVDGVDYTMIREKVRSGEVSAKTYADNYTTVGINADARYVKIVGHGRYTYANSGRPGTAPNNTWTSIAEIVFLQKAIIDPNGAPITGNKLLAEGECFNLSSEATVEKDQNASGREVVKTNVAYTSNPGAVSGQKAQMSATFIPQKTGTYYIWAKVNASKVTSGDTMWVNIQGVTGDTYYGEKVNVGKADANGFIWIKLGQNEAQIANAKWQAGEKYTLSVISGCKGLAIDCFIVTADASYVPYSDMHHVITSVEGDVKANGKDAIYEYANAKSSGTNAVLQKVSGDGKVTQAYIDHVLNTKNLPGDIGLKIETNTSGLFTIWATIKYTGANQDRFFYAVSANEDAFNYKMFDLSDLNATAGEFVTVQLGQIEIQASEFIYVRIRACDSGVTVGSLYTTCELVEGVYTTTGGKLTIQAEDAQLGQAGEETIIIDKGAYYSGELTKIVESTGAAGGKAVQLVRGYSAWNQMIVVTSEANPHITFRVMPDQSGEPFIWAKVYAPKGASIYAWIDGGEDTFYWRQPLTQETFSVDTENYIWVRLYQEYRVDTTLKMEHLYYWTARRVYNVSLRANTAGVRVDEIYVTFDPNDKPHNHMYSEQWSSNETHHWYQPTCGCADAELRYYAEHYFEDHTDLDCNTCGYKNPNYAPHNYVNDKCTICGGLAPFKTSGGKLTLEAENLMLAPDGSENHIAGHTGSVIKTVQNAGASGAMAVQFTRSNPSWNTYLNAGTTPIPHLSVLVTPDKSGEYYIWLRAYVPAGAINASAIYCYIDGGDDTYYWRQPLNLSGNSQGEGDYIWVKIGQEWRASALTSERHYTWKAGQTYKLRFRGFLSGVQIDQIHVTTDANYAPHNHTYSEKWSSNENQHWREPTCSDTKLVVGTADHIFDNLLDTTCNTCGYVRPPHEHSFNAFGYDKTNHWKECTCGQKSDQSTHNFTDGFCTVCGLAQPIQIGSGGLTIQAEDAKLDLEKDINNKSATSTGTGNVPLSVINNAFASGGRIVRTLGYYPDAVYTKWTSAEPGHIEITVTPSTTGTHYIWAKVLTPNASTNVRVLIDGDTKNGDTAYVKQEISSATNYSSDYAGATLGTSQDFVWVKFSGTYEWTEGGAYVIRIRSTSINVVFDEFYITTDAEFEPHKHTYSEKWSMNENQHWHEPTCDDTTLVVDQADHVYDDISDTICNTCDYVRPAHEHNYSTFRYNKTNHWKECACGQKSDESTHNFTDGSCTVCGLARPIQIGSGGLTIQAEDAKLDLEKDINNKSATSTGTGNVPLSVINNAFASGGKIVRTLGYYPDAVYTKWTSAEPGHIEITVTPSTTGTHYIWAKVLTPNASTNVRVLIDGDTKNGDTAYVKQEISSATNYSSDYAGATLGTCKDFVWVKFSGTYEWTEGGAYVIRIRSTSINVSFDEFYITADPEYTPHTHTYSTTWSKDADYHWHAADCEHTDLIADKAEHVYENAYDNDCNICGYGRAVHEHSYTILRYDNANHWNECVCGEKSGITAHSFVDGHCAGCGLAQPIQIGSSGLTIQAEDANLYLEKDTSNKAATSTGTGSVPLSVINNTFASGGKIVRTLGYYPQGVYTAWTSAEPGHIEITVTPSTTGTHYIWAKALTPNASTNVRVLIDGDTKNGDTAYVKQAISSTTNYSADYAGGSLGTCQDFVWVKFSGTYEWTEGGAYVIRIRSSSINVSFDEFYITNEVNDIP